MDGCRASVNYLPWNWTDAEEKERERERKIARSYSSGVRNLSSSCGFRRTPVKLAEA